MISRRLALVASLSLAGLVLGACGDAPGRTAAGLPKISLSASGSGVAASADAAGTADERMTKMPYWNVDYVYDGSLPDLGADATAYRFAVGATPDLDQVRRIADALGLSGEISELPADQGGGWQIGAADYSGPVLTVARDGLLSWWFNGISNEATWGCAVEGSDPSTDVAPAPDAAVTPDTTVRCDEPTPPAGVPDAAAAEELASAMLDSIGIDPADLEFETYADEWSAWVTAFRMIDGVRSPMAWSFGYGADGALTSASGVLAEAEEVGDYPIVATAAGLERLNDDTGRWGWFGGPAFAARGAAVSAVATGEVTASSDGSVVSGGGTDAVAPSTDVAVPVPVEPTGTVVVETIAPDCLANDACVPLDSMPMETQIVTLTGVRLGLTSYWDTDGTVWLLPSYEFTSADGGVWSVIAVDETYLDIPEVPMPEPMPVEPAPVDPGAALPEPIETAVAESALVGLTEDEAMKVVVEKGWILRVSTIDGVGQPLTMDYSPMRVNVALTDGVVTAIDSIG